MRRPLCTAIIAGVLLLWLFLPLIWSDLKDRLKEEAQLHEKWEVISVSGTVEEKETHISPDGTEVMRVTVGIGDPSIPQNAKNTFSRLRGWTYPRCPLVLCEMEPSEADVLPIGCQAVIAGKFLPFSEATNPGAFDEQLYYGTLHYRYRLKDATTLSRSDSYDVLGERLYQIRRKLGKSLDQVFDEEDAAVLHAMLFGERGYLSSETKDLFQRNGIIHIIAISGLHISLLGMGLYRILCRLLLLPLSGRSARLTAALFSLGFILLYGKMTGSGPSSLRAIIMFTLYLTAKLLGRTYDLMTALSIAAALILLDQPLFLLHSGFLFSFGCVAAIGALMPAMRGRLMKALTIPIATLPVQMQFYYRIPIYSVLLNLAVVPLMGVVMLSGIAALLLQTLCSGFGGLMIPGRVAGFPAHAILTFYHNACIAAGALPGAGAVTGRAESWQVAAYLILLIIMVVSQDGTMMPDVDHSIRTMACIPALKKRFSKVGGYARRWPSVICALWVFAAVLLLLQRDRSGLRVTMLDVGQGDGIVLSFGETDILIDGGSSDQSELSRYRLEPFLLSQGIDSIELAILTHDDIDHCSGLIGMLEDPDRAISIERLCLPDIGEASKGENFRHIEALAESVGIPVSYLSAGESIELFEDTAGWRSFKGAGAGQKTGLELMCFNPVRDKDYLEANAYSATLYLTYGKFSMLLTGDLEEEGEQDVIRYLSDELGATAQQSMKVTVLKVAHHGSRGATTEEFLKVVQPRVALISAGRDNRYGHPHRELLERLMAAGTDIYITNESGAITVQTDGSTAEIKQYLLNND